MLAPKKLRMALPSLVAPAHAHQFIRGALKYIYLYAIFNSSRKSHTQNHIGFVKKSISAISPLQKIITVRSCKPLIQDVFLVLRCSITPHCINYNIILILYEYTRQWSRRYLYASYIIIMSRAYTRSII